MSVRGTVIKVDVNLVTETCCACGVVFAMAEEFYDECQRAKRDKSFYCPNGHSQFYTGKSDAQIIKELKSRVEAEQDNAKFWREQEAAAQRRVNAARGQITKIKKRVGNGVCPCCNRQFVQLERHMKSQHPDFVEAPDA